MKRPFRHAKCKRNQSRACLPTWLCLVLFSTLSVSSQVSSKTASHVVRVLESSDANVNSNSTSTTTETQPNNVMTDQNIQEAVDIWCENPTMATRFFGHISDWNTSLVTNFRALFRKKRTFNDEISKWDTSRITSMAACFEEARSFDQDLSAWITSSVVSMSAMFSGASSFTGTKGGSSMAHWDVSSVTRMDRM